MLDQDRKRMLDAVRRLPRPAPPERISTMNEEDALAFALAISDESPIGFEDAREIVRMLRESTPNDRLLHGWAAATAALANAGMPVEKIMSIVRFGTVPEVK